MQSTPLPLPENSSSHLTPFCFCVLVKSTNQRQAYRWAKTKKFSLFTTTKPLFITIKKANSANHNITMDDSSSTSSTSSRAEDMTAAQHHLEEAGYTEYTSRISIRTEVHRIIRRLLRERLAQQRFDLMGGDQEEPPPFPRLTTAQRTRAKRQSHLLEDILYRRACCLEEYQDMDTLEDRVFKAGRAVYINAQRREMERESQRRMRPTGGEGEGAAAKGGSGSGRSGARRGVLDNSCRRITRAMAAAELRRADSI